MSATADAALLALFASEAEERLSAIVSTILDAEAAGLSDEQLVELFRHAHTVKGSAGVVGFTDVAAVAHALEDVLDELRQHHRDATPALLAALLDAADGLRTLVRASLRGSADPATATALVGCLSAVAREPAPEPTPAPPEPPPAPPLVALVRPDSPPSSPLGQEEAPVLTRSRETDAVRVPLARLDELVRLVGESAAAHLRLGRYLSERLGSDPGSVAEFQQLSRVLTDLQQRVMQSRMVPVATIAEPLRRAARDVARSLGKEVHWEVRGEDTELDRSVLDRLVDPLVHLVRNAVDHGVESPEERIPAGKPVQGIVRLHAMQIGSEAVLALSDDGRGVEVDAVRSQATRLGLSSDGTDDATDLIFNSGLSTSRSVTDISGRGVGLDVVRAALEAVRGRVEVHSVPGEGTEFRLVVPLTLAVLPSLLVGAGDRHFAIPLHTVVTIVPPEDVRLWADGRNAVYVGSSTVPVSDLATTLGLGERCAGPVVVMGAANRRHAFQVDTFLGQRDVVVKALGGLLPQLDVLAGASTEPDGSILLVLDGAGLIERAHRSGHRERRVAQVAPAVERGEVLVVDDALTVRELQRSILERAGYRVRTANDGVEALALLAERPSDLVLTDVEMPRLDGFGLTEEIRLRPALASTGVIILTSRASDDDRRRGLESGADGYIVKSEFDETGLLAAIERVTGKRAA